MLGLTVRYFKEVEDLCPKNDNQSAIESNDIFHTEWANNTAALLTNHENSLKDLREEVQYRKSILTGFSKLEKIEGEEVFQASVVCLRIRATINLQKEIRVIMLYRSTYTKCTYY